MIEANFDGLPGPTHHYAGLAHGNIASLANANRASNPRAAALQGLDKMRLLHGMGALQGIFPPQPRPALRWLHSLGFTGKVKAVMERVADSAPELLPYCYSASSMWAANAATVTHNGVHTHVTPANLVSTPHRALEAEFTATMLRAIFPHRAAFIHHAPLPANLLLADEGAANHMRLSDMQIFVYGRDAARHKQSPQKFPARQTLQASEAVARLHGLPAENTLFLQQNPRAIDAGVFHNDVVAVSHENLLLFHEHAYLEAPDLPKDRYRMICVKEAEISLEDTVATYLFNSQIVSLPGGGMAYIAPSQCKENHAAAALLGRWLEDDKNPITKVHYVDLRQSMRNGGGPACLRLRVPMRQNQWQAVHAGVKFSETLYTQLKAWISQHYRERLTPDDLRDPALAEASYAALEELEGILGLRGLYDL